MSDIFGTLWTIVEFILAFGVLVFLHEFGHYIMSKLFGIQVEEFGFGFPPRLVKLFNFRETEFTLNWIPFGAFVRPKGENDPAVPGGLASASPWARLAVLSAGSLMNLVTGIALFFIFFARVGVPEADPTRVIIQGVSENSPAEAAGIQVNDIVVSFNGEPVNSMDELASLVRANWGQPVAIELDRGGQTVQVGAVLRANPTKDKGALGILYTNPILYRPTNLSGAFGNAVRVTYEQGRQLISLPGRLLRGEVSAEEGRVVGPKGIFDIYQSARERDEEELSAPQPKPAAGQNTFLLIATLSVALGYTNLLPIPALDGGRILFVLPEILIRRRVPAQYENMIHLIGFALLIVLMIVVTGQDIINPVDVP